MIRAKVYNNGLSCSPLLCSTFDANLTELERYVASLYTVQEFIIQRQQETLHEMYRASERSLLGVEQHLLRDVILKLILGNGAVSVHQLDKERLEVVESLLESRFLRWRCVKVKKRQKRLTRIGSNDSSTSVGCSMPESLSDEFDTSLSTSSSSDLLYMYRMEGVEVVWQNILVGRAFEQWFNETF